MRSDVCVSVCALFFLSVGRSPSPLRPPPPLFATLTQPNGNKRNNFLEAFAETALIQPEDGTPVVKLPGWKCRAEGVTGAPPRRGTRGGDAVGHREGGNAKAVE